MRFYSWSKEINPMSIIFAKKDINWSNIKYIKKKLNEKNIGHSRLWDG